jgi:hypothetical protein
MNESQKPDFVKMITEVLAFYKQDTSRFAISVWWEAAKHFDFEQVSKALTAHAMDPDRGQFPPKPADLVRQLQVLATATCKKASGCFSHYSTRAAHTNRLHQTLCQSVKFISGVSNDRQSPNHLP